MADLERRFFVVREASAFYHLNGSLTLWRAIQIHNLDARVRLPFKETRQPGDD
jgi:hypothetical protein